MQNAVVEKKVFWSFNAKVAFLNVKTLHYK